MLRGRIDGRQVFFLNASCANKRFAGDADVIASRWHIRFDPQPTVHSTGVYQGRPDSLLRCRGLRKSEFNFLRQHVRIYHQQQWYLFDCHIISSNILMNSSRKAGRQALAAFFSGLGAQRGHWYSIILSCSTGASDERHSIAFPPLSKLASVGEAMMQNVLLHCGLIQF